MIWHELFPSLFFFLVTTRIQKSVFYWAIPLVLLFYLWVSLCFRNTPQFINYFRHLSCVFFFYSVDITVSVNIDCNADLYIQYYFSQFYWIFKIFHMVVLKRSGKCFLIYVYTLPLHILFSNVNWCCWLFPGKWKVSWCSSVWIFCYPTLVQII